MDCSISVPLSSNAYVFLHCLQVDFRKQCGNDKICQPDLAIKGEVTYGDG